MMRKNLGERVVMQSMFVILVEQSENFTKIFDVSGWRVLLWLTMIEMKMLGKALELIEGLTWVQTMEVAI